MIPLQLFCLGQSYHVQVGTSGAWCWCQDSSTQQPLEVGEEAFGKQQSKC